MPTILFAGDSVVITACFTPKDTSTQIDTIMLAAGCFNLPIDLIGNANIPIIFASDHDFGPVIVDSTKCDTVGVYNIGKMPFTLTTNWVLDKMGVNFTFDNLGSNLPAKSFGSDDLPIVLNPGAKVLLNFCYTPHAEEHDSSVVHWGTTLADPYKHSKKDSSRLYGEGVRTGFVWDRTEQPMTININGIDSLIIRVYLFNNAPRGSGAPPAHVDSVFITGVNAAEFYILSNERGFNPPDNFDLNSGDSVWFDIVFNPSRVTPKPPLDIFQYAQLVARDRSETDKVIDFTGVRTNGSGVKETPQQSQFSIFPNPATGNGIIISFSLSEPTEAGSIISIFDVLGREVYRNTTMSGTSQIALSIKDLQNGMYYARLTSGNMTTSGKFEILK